MELPASPNKSAQANLELSSYQAASGWSLIGTTSYTRNTCPVSHHCSLLSYCFICLTHSNVSPAPIGTWVGAIQRYLSKLMAIWAWLGHCCPYSYVPALVLRIGPVGLCWNADLDKCSLLTKNTGLCSHRSGEGWPKGLWSLFLKSQKARASIPSKLHNKLPCLVPLLIGGPIYKALSENKHKWSFGQEGFSPQMLTGSKPRRWIVKGCGEENREWRKVNSTGPILAAADSCPTPSLSFWEDRNPKFYV